VTRSALDDARLMRKAIALAERGRGTTSPNPLVGALVVDDEGVIVGRGAHRAAGGPHAEVLALQDAGGKARGATLYCTLEPCAHTGRTGPCAPLVGNAGIRRVVVALEDPNPLVDGRGVAHLRDRGIEVAVGIEREAAARQNAAFLTNIRFARPYVVLKAALSLDGRLAEAPGVRTPLTGPAANRRVQRQRAEVDAVGVGSGTVLTDDPLLTPRGVYRERPLTRVIFDRRLRTPPAARVFSTLESGPVRLVSSERARHAAADRAAALSAAGGRLLVLKADDLDLDSACRALGASGVVSLVLEGGAALHRAALEADIVDAVHLYITPRRLGEGGVPWTGGGLIAWESLRDRSAVWLGPDVLVEAMVERHVHGHR
jgi:diaminohydroxyphosphoribosylaminopyrimidine deaminase/5-amino-6-(5-phosphoribosylamino)uracil reductase